MMWSSVIPFCWRSKFRAIGHRCESFGLFLSGLAEGIQSASGVVYARTLGYYAISMRGAGA